MSTIGSCVLCSDLSDLALDRVYGQAMRQDCTVQHINNAFTAEVYEAHARAALDYGEMGDYIQCQVREMAGMKRGKGACSLSKPMKRLPYRAAT